MAVSGSPDIISTEEDLSTYVAANSLTVGAFVGDFDWGPVDEATTLASEADLVKIFGKPVDRNYQDWFSARNYLQYSSYLRCIRAIGTDIKNACDVEEEATLIKSTVGFNTIYNSLWGTGKRAKIFARYPGILGNKIQVIMYDKQSREASGDLLASYIAKNMTDDDVAIGVFMNGELKDVNVHSLLTESTDYSGYPNYLFNFVNNNSQYVYLIKENIVTFDEAGKRNPININVVLSGGVSAERISSADYMLSWNKFKNADLEDPVILFQGGAPTDVGTYIIDLAEGRKDCIACVSPQMTDVVNSTNPVEKINITEALYQNSSYRFMDGNYKYQYDAYNDKYRWVPMNADCAGLMAQTDAEEYPWFSPGGKQIKDCIKLAFYPDKTQRDELFSCNVNPITSFKNEGHVLWGDWTGVNNTAFNFVGVRRGFIYMKKQLLSAARKVMWKQNDEVSQTQFIQIAEPFLRRVEGGRGITEFRIFCDGNVNTKEVKDQGIFIAKIVVKPIGSIRWVHLIFTATRSSVSIEEVVS